MRAVFNKKVAEKYNGRIDDGSLALMVADTLSVQMELTFQGLLPRLHFGARRRTGPPICVTT